MTVSVPLWRPDRARVASSGLQRFADHAAATLGAPALTGDWTRDYPSLWRWSVGEPAAFWSGFFDHAGLIAERGSAPVLQDAQAMPGARWFADTRLNYAENLLAGADADIVLWFADERGNRRQLCRKQLREQVMRVAAALGAEGVGAGDVVAGYLPNIPEALVAMLATTALGAVWTSTSPDFGVDGVAERFGQVGAKVLFVADGYSYGGKSHSSLRVLDDLLPRLPSLRRVVVVPYLASTPDLAGLPLSRVLDDWLAAHAAAAWPGYERVPFGAPLFILYSSGTTGKPKCIVHSVGGTLLQHRKEHLLHADVRAGDRLFFFTTCGWMMWNWLVSGLASGAAIVLYEGSPVHPDNSALWQLADTAGVTHFGTSPRYLAGLEKAGYRPRENHGLAALRAVLSTGSPLAPEQFDFVHEAIKADVHLASMSGGTDIISCFCLGVPCLPVYRGELQGAGLGLAVAVWDESGRQVEQTRGDLVCTAPFPSMPIGFISDPQQQRYRAAYFSRFPGVWHHGDYAMTTAHGGFVILGRSDAVLNPGGVRIGTAEIYRQVEKLPEILESLAVGQQRGNDERVVLFVRLRPGVALGDELQQRIRSVIRENTTPRHVPARILAVSDLPRTRSGKLVELAVRNVVNGRAVENLEAIANPEALRQCQDRPELAD